MATQAVKVKDEQPRENAITSAVSGVGERVGGALTETREFLHDTRVEMKQVTWPSRQDVVSTTGVVIATVFFFGVFLFFVDKGVEEAVRYIFKVFGV
jgi:preprotein translocase subunit SecE